MSPEAAEAPAGGDHPMVGEGRLARLAEDVADGPRRARSTGKPRHVTIGDHATGRNPAKDVQHTAGEGSGPGHHRASASCSGLPLACGSLIPTTDANVATISSGETGLAYLPGTTPAPSSATGTCWS